MEPVDRAELVKAIMFRTGCGYKTVSSVLDGCWRSKSILKRTAAKIIDEAKKQNFPFDQPPEELSFEPLPSLKKLTEDEYPNPDDPIEDQLRFLLGPEKFLTLVENFAGCRLFVPSSPERSNLLDILGATAVMRLSEVFQGGYIKVPLARDFRAEIYYKQGQSNRKIAVRLGLTESGTERLLKRLRRKGRL